MNQLSSDCTMVRKNSRRTGIPPRAGTCSRLTVVMLGACLAGCTMQAPRTQSESIYRISPSTWFEDGFSSYDVSPSGRQALFRSWYGIRVIHLEERSEDKERAGDGLDNVRWAVFDHEGAVVRFGRRGEQTGWFAEGEDGPRQLPLPPGGLPRWSPDGSQLAYDTGQELWIGTLPELRSVQLTGSVTALGWAPDGASLYALVSGQDGSSSLIRVSRDSATQAVRGGLDGPKTFDRLAVSPDGRILYLTLVSDSPPDNEARHQPDVDRDTDIYALELASGQLRAVVSDPGDDFNPVIAGGHLFWTHNELREQIVVVPIDGGAAKVVVEDGQIPYWSHDGRRLAFTLGGWRIADWALNLDAAMVDVDAEGRPLGVPERIVAGYHEDFTPVWSPDGKWIAYHSHRSNAPVSAYEAEGSTDDIYLRSTVPGSEEIRLTDFGWEVGNPDWAPDGRRLVFDSQDRNGVPWVFKAWIIHIDPATGRPQRVEPLPTPEGPPGFRIMSWSPTADEIALTYPLDGMRHGLSVVSPTGQPVEKLVEFDATTQGGLDWTPDGRRIVFSALVEGGMQLFVIDRSGGQPRRLSDDSNSLILPQVSPDGRWIAATRLLRAKELRRIRLP